MHFGFAFRCPICRSRLKRFLPAGVPPRANALCPVCGAVERHRLIWYVIRQKRLLSPVPSRHQIRLLHVAPEDCLRDKFENRVDVDYWSSSLDGNNTRVSFDITRPKIDDNFFDAILCSHVLEHVIDDRLAIRSFYRILKPNGWAILQIPIDMTRDTTYEDWAIETPEGREIAFGQYDHVRIYGRDYLQRLTDAGFKAEIIYSGHLPGRGTRRFGFDDTEPVFFCMK